MLGGRDRHAGDGAALRAGGRFGRARDAGAGAHLASKDQARQVGAGRDRRPASTTSIPRSGRPSCTVDHRKAGSSADFPVQGGRSPRAGGVVGRRTCGPAAADDGGMPSLPTSNCHFSKISLPADSDPTIADSDPGPARLGPLHH